MGNEGVHTVKKAIQVGGEEVSVDNPMPVSSVDANNFKTDANMQVGNADVATGNPVPVSDAGGTLTVDQSTHDNFNANANLQISDADNAVGNPAFAQLTPSTAEIGKLGAGSAVIGHVILDAGTAEIGKLGAGTAEIGKLGAGTAEIGKLGAGSAVIGHVILDAGTAEIGKLGAGTAEIGKLGAGSAVIGHVVLDAGTAQIGNVGISQNLIAATKTTEIQTHFAKNTAAGTEQTAVQIAKPASPVLMYKAAMTNSSIDSALTVKLFNRRTFTLTGTAQTDGAPDNTHIVLAATANPTDDHYNTFVITITAGTGIGQSKTISDYVGSTQRALISGTWDVTPDNTSVYSIALVRDSLAWTGNFAKASLTAPIVKARDSEIIPGSLFDNGCDVYYVVSNDVLIANADASRFTAVFQLIPIAQEVTI